MSARLHCCIRCGIPVCDQGAACRDCRKTDPLIIRSWTRKDIR